MWVNGTKYVKASYVDDHVYNVDYVGKWEMETSWPELVGRYTPPQ